MSEKHGVWDQFLSILRHF